MLQRLNHGRLRGIHDDLHLDVLVGMGQNAGQPLGGSLKFFMGAIVLMIVSSVFTHVELLLRAQIVIVLIAIFF
jgi:hypothetical protein